MSFITKRERVFNEYDLFDLPARNEGKLKAYASCTDARAWSHFCSDKSEHLVEIIKRNNETVRSKYIPTDVIVNTLMTAKNAEIARLKRKIGELEQLLSAYDLLDLTCDQKCDIANAHAAIKAANKELDDMCLDLDLSSFTEGIDSEAFETGKSRGDEPSRHTDEVKSKGDETGKSGGDELKWVFEKEKESTPRKETKASQAGTSCTCDVSTSAHDPQVVEMQETIISKDAKLNAMQNTLAVMEHDVCEPYCIYAHIYTALEKIFGILCQNAKYKQYLDLLTAGKDTRGIDIKGKILFKIKVLEKFSLALIAPCSQDFSSTSQDCSCYRAEVVTHVETTFALTSAENQKPILDNKRAQLVADIMDNQEMKEILSKESLCLKIEDDQFDECFGVDNYSIDVENLNRLKNLQANYDELLNCYDNLKHERDCLYLRCQTFANLENECDCLKNKLREYSELWKEKEFYRKRSEDLDILKENYFILSEETSNIETKFKAEQEITKIKSETIDELRNENIKLEQKLGDTSLAFEKQKNILICKLKECECKMMCQEQQIKSLSSQIDKLLEQDTNKIPSDEDTLRSVQLIDEVESQKEQIHNLKDALCCSEEEKQYLQEEFEQKLELINTLKCNIEDWKSKYEKALINNNYLEKYLDQFQLQINELQDKHVLMNKELENRTTAIENLNNIISSKSQEINNLMEERDLKKDENMELITQIKTARTNFDNNLAILINERNVVMKSILTAKQQSRELFNNFRDKVNTNEIIQTIEMAILNQKLHSNSRIQILEKNTNKNIDSKDLVNEIEQLQEINIENINTLQNENAELKKLFDLAKKENEAVENKLTNQENMLKRYDDLKQSNANLQIENQGLRIELNCSINKIDNICKDFELSKKTSKDLLEKSLDIKAEYMKLKVIYDEVLNQNNILQKEISDKESKIKDLSLSIKSLKLETNHLLLRDQEIKQLQQSLNELQNKYSKLTADKTVLQTDLISKTEEMSNLYKNLETQIEENQTLHDQIKFLQARDMSSNSNISALKNENYDMQLNFNAIKTESAKLLDKIKQFGNLQSDYDNLKLSHDKIKQEKENLIKDLNSQIINFKKFQHENYDLNNQNKNLLIHSENLEKALIISRNENLSRAGSINDIYADVKKEIEKLKEQKLADHERIKSLMDKLDESDCIITNLTEDIIARDKRIATLENHINELELEIRALQSNLVEVVESGEQLKRLSFEKLNQSLRKLEAHQSKATHNMRIEQAKLKNEKENLKDQLSDTQIMTEELLQEKYDYKLQIDQQQKERELIVSDIKQLEIKCNGDSNLSPNTCSLNEVKISLQRIGKCLDSKNFSIEQTLLKVQASYQLLKVKADEAKNIAEIERQKIAYEKEQHEIERMNVERQLDNLKAKLKNETINYEKIIKDVQGEALNQKLIFDKIKQTTDSHVLKLKEENILLQNKCDKFCTDMIELKEKLQHTLEQKLVNDNTINNINITLEEKNKLLLVLQRQLENIKNKPLAKESEVQTVSFITKKNIMCQTEIDNRRKGAVKKSMLNENVSEEVKLANNNIDRYHDSDISCHKTSHKYYKLSNILSNIESSPIHEVQILTANVEPKIDFIKNIYFKYKIKRLSPGKLEQYSIASLDDTNLDGLFPSYDLVSETRSPEISLSKNTNLPLNQNNDSIIDIYNTQISTNSTKFTDEIYTDIRYKEHIHPLADVKTNYKIIKNSNMSYIKNQIRKSGSNINDSIQSTDKDLFVIYKDNDSTYDENTASKNFEATKETVKAKEYTQNMKKKVNQKNLDKEENIYAARYSSDERDDDSIKPKLKINLPRFINDSPSTITTLDVDKRSLDSYTHAIYASPKRDVYSETNIGIKNPEKFEVNIISLPSACRNNIIKEIFKTKTIHSNENIENQCVTNIKLKDTKIVKDLDIKNIFSKQSSNHKLSRVGANVLILQNTTNHRTQGLANDVNVKSNYGLQYILNTVQREVSPDSTINLNIIQSLSKSQSEEKYVNKSESIDQSSQSKQFSTLKMSSTECRTISTNSPVYTKSVSDRGILVKIDAIEDYENKIQQLTKALENIENEYKKKIEAVKVQYDCNVKSIINEHDHGVQSIQNLHEETLRDIRKIHENEAENLRTMSIEAMREAERLEIENRGLKAKLQHDRAILDEEPVKIPSPDMKKRICKCRINSKTLTKTNVEAFNVHPKRRSHGPCTCSLDLNISETIRNIFEQVDVEQRKLAEQAYIKYIANKIFDGNVETLDAQELSFLHLKVCRTWKTKLNKEEVLQKKIDSLENELMNKQRQTQKHMAELDRKVAEEWHRLQEVREALCKSSAVESRDSSPAPMNAVSTADRDKCSCNTASCNITVRERRSAGDLASGLSGAITAGWRRKRGKLESNRAVLPKLDGTEGRREKVTVCDETPTRLKRAQDRHNSRVRKKKE